MHEQCCFCIWEAAQSFSIAFLPPTCRGKSENTALLSNVSRVAATPFNGASACLRCLVFLFPGKLRTAAVRPVCLLCYSSAPGWIPTRLLLLHRSRNLMNCTNLRLTSDPVFLSLDLNHHWGWVLYFHIRHTGYNTHTRTHVGCVRVW